jgi:CRP-like cAMP-binding protein
MKGFMESDFARLLSAEDLGDLQGFVSIVEFSAGSLVCSEGGPAEHLFIVRTGAVVLSRRGRPVGLLHEGALIGEGALLAERRHLADVIARSDITAYGVHASGLAAYMQSHPAAATRFLLWVVHEMTVRLQAASCLLGAITDVGQAATSHKPLALIGRDVLEMLLRDLGGAVGAALFVWNRFAGVYELLSAVRLDLDCGACESPAEPGRVFYLRDGMIAGVRMAQEEPVGVVFVSRDRERPPFTPADEILFETVGHHLTLAIHRAQDSREEAARDRLRCHPRWQD